MVSATTTPAERKARLTKTFAYYSAFIVLGLAGAVTGPTLEGLSRHTRSTVEQISYLFVLRSLGYLIGSFTAGRLYDRVKGHPLMVSVICIMVLAMFLIPLVPLLWLLAGVVMILGIAEGLLDVGGNTLLVWVHREEMKPYMTGLHFFYGLGALVSPIIVGIVLANTSDIYWAYWSLGLLMLLPAMWLARLRSPQPIVETETAPTKPALPVLIGLIALFGFLYVGAEGSYGGFVSKYTFDMGLQDVAGAAYLASAFWGAITAGRLLSIPLASRFKALAILLADLLLALIGMALVLAFPGSLAVLWVGTLLVGLGMASVFPTMLILAEQYMTITGRITSWFFVGSSLGGMTLPWVIGQLYAPVGPRVTMMAITTNLVLDLVILGVIILYSRRIRG
jgi:MFS transporter, FHS family, Na+ dependent glucose transporter 1